MIVPKEKITRVVFDFDNTLFDTERRKQLLYEMAMLHGYSKEEGKKMYDEARVVGEKIVISLSSYISILQEYVTRDKKQFRAVDVSSLIQKMHHGDGLLSGAKKLLFWCKSLPVEMYLLSLGVRGWQEEKVAQAGIADFFGDEHIVYTDKVDNGKIKSLQMLFGENFKGEGTLIFNDKPDETAALLQEFPGLVACVRREPLDDRFSEDSYTDLKKNFPDRVVCSERLEELNSVTALLFQKI
jgi:phosphoglycolate phosphatase-like HAD superfamily hydrolase